MTLTSTYRIQHHAGHTLARTREILPYLDALGISHLYSSPLLKARPGSQHGYDVADPAAINPEIGSEDELRALAGELGTRGMGLILDIVPNHMGIGESNPYWEDMLRHGRDAQYAPWFDVDWDAHPKHRGKVVLPVLGGTLDEVLAKQELGLLVRDGQVRLRYYDNSWPLDPRTLPEPLEVAALDPNAWPAAEAWVAGAEGAARLRALLEAQHYRLLHWRCAPQDINYRRFFDVNELAALRIGDPAVYAATHARILAWVGEGLVQGLRIDHVDGLRDPLGYLQRLRADCERLRPRDGVGATEEFPIFVEKILSPGEALRRDWPVQGTTGYEFLNDLEALFIDWNGAVAIEGSYRRMLRLGARERAHTFAEVAREGKLKMLRGPLRADMRRLARLLARALPAGTSPDLRVLQAGVVQLIAALPVYRTYVDGRTPLPAAEDREVLQRAVAIAQERTTPEEHAVVARIAELFLAPFDPHDAPRKAFIEAFQQVSGPATAKGVEDTALYVYFPLASRNEVGGEPDRSLHHAVRELHEANAHRAAHWPLSLLATNTHDTKRSADLRARIDVLSEVPGEWALHVQRWRRLNRGLRAAVAPGGMLVPDTNTEYLLYQTLLGLWPAGREDELPEERWFEGVRARLEGYLMKAVREAKVHTSWTDPNAEYEQGVVRFLHALLDPRQSREFLVDMGRLVQRVAPAGLVNDLARVTVHLTAPGTPDTYQGDELLGHTLVDPDNRRPVKYEHRIAFLADVERRMVSDAAGFARELSRKLADPRLKLMLLRQLLHARRGAPELFRRGSYDPLEPAGPRAGHLFGFLRREGGRAALVLVPRCSLALMDLQGGITGSAWEGTTIPVPAELAGRSWRSALTGAKISPGPTLEVGTVLSDLPVAVLLA
ncbi:MAG: malto-oligosyltrehalose synthase [Gemmatimonadaceae bacterium]